MIKIIDNRIPVKEMLKRLNNPYEVHKFEIGDDMPVSMSDIAGEENYAFICTVCRFGFTRKEINIFHGDLLNIKLIRNAVDCIPIKNNRKEGK